MLKIQQTIVNSKGERLIFDEIAKLDTFNSFYITRIDENVGLLSLDGFEIIKPFYDKIIPTEYELFIVEKEKKCGLVNTAGDLILPVKYDKIDNNCSENIVKIYLGGKIGFFNLSTNECIEPIYDCIKSCFKGIMKAQKGGKYGFVNTHGIEVIPLIYDDISEFYEDVAQTTINHKMGYITRDGFEILPAEYDELSDFEFGFGFARQGKSNICVDKTGKIIFMLNIVSGIQLTNENYEKLSFNWCDEYFHFKCGLNLIKQDGQYRCQSDDGCSVLQCFY